jgi:hypothetical protein
MALDVGDSLFAALRCVLCGAVGGSGDCTCVFPLCASGNTLYSRQAAVPVMFGRSALIVADRADLRASYAGCFLWLRFPYKMAGIADISRHHPYSSREEAVTMLEYARIRRGSNAGAVRLRQFRAVCARGASGAVAPY